MSSQLSEARISYIDSVGNPYLEGAWESVFDEITATDLKCIGEIPSDLNGVYLRNGPNPKYQPRGRYHVFDGDGMIHAAEFRNGQVTYRNRFVRTKGLAMEDQARQAIWPGLIERPDRSLVQAWGSDQWLKDNSNTDVVLFNGRALSTFYQCGEGYVLNPITLDTESTLDFASLGVRSMSAHSMVDENTGELLFFDYSTQRPFMTYGVLSPDGKLKHFTPVELPGPRLPHTLAFTENYTILMDLPLFWDPELMQRDIHKVTFYPELPSRFGILKRYGDGNTIRWFEAEPTYIYHICNAWEEDGEIVLDGCRMGTPEPPAVPAGKPDGDYSRLLAWGNLDARLHRWRFNLRTGETHESYRDDRYTEFPMVNGGFAGRKSRYSYNVLIDQNNTTLRMEGLVKYDLENGTATEHRFGPQQYGSESPFAPRDGSQSEDDGYVVTFVTDAAEQSSELQIFDAQHLSEGPVGRVKLPGRVPPGFHSCWAPESYLR